MAIAVGSDVEPMQDCVATCNSLTVDASYNFEPVNYTEPLDQGETFSIKAILAHTFTKPNP